MILTCASYGPRVFVLVDISENNVKEKIYLKSCTACAVPKEQHLSDDIIGVRFMLSQQQYR